VSEKALRILLVEDNPGDAELLREMLRGLPFSLDVVETLKEGIARVRDDAPDVVLLDLSLPDAQGVTSVQAMQATSPSTPVIVITGLDDEEVGLHAVQQGAQDYLVKGRIGPDVIVRSIRFAVERKRVEVTQQQLAAEKAARAHAEHLYRQLDETHRAILALYGELDEKSDSLRRTAEVKSRIVSNVSHEFRTPLNSILGLARLLLSRSDGPLTAEQEKQLGFIFRSATELSELVSDLLDLSRMEAGKVRLHARRFHVEELFAAMRGMVGPLPRRPEVDLIFVDPDGPLSALETDEAKVSQVLRNLVSNAIKFTERGAITVRARQDGSFVAFEVQDTGIGIAPGDLERVFEEFTQIENPLQREQKGSGLGLSLSRKLAELLAGTLTATSEPGRGSTFTLTIPLVHPEVTEMKGLTDRAGRMEPDRQPVLVVEDDRQTVFLYEKYLRGSGFQVLPARTVDEARAVMKRLRPAAVVLDIMLEGEATWGFLADMKSDPTTRDIPILVVTVTDRENKARALGADEFWMKPLDQEWLLGKLKNLSRRGPVEKVLVIDDDEVSRYIVRRLLSETPYQVMEATGGEEGIRLARKELPDVILLDFVMPGMTAFEVLDELKGDARTRRIPVIIHTSKDLRAEERERLSSAATAILNKQSLSREVALGRIRDALMQAGVASYPEEAP
jgi:signal transduction histidine kinase